ncbi:hypothetical protein ASG40_11815 [Methylobacterium sp. Leaf399]|uniref:hypothetical protein n=1 Tax=unclassified Methylobacterium TaxID=2615210 RepID=UPI0007000174|nr:MULTISPECIES: hypothetical protein [unclassified Methylobacterium]KQP50543.1 hypothetical protein ASF39_12705 [Methylobacterium sp. Leaf108]KQT08555.1 hypothetical protein ASG40_11815 [Methylobacterium sp. Leaf399]KQT81875.1 hypothetical protein ASG59_19065 [Methylobacterium sp. Leaf466]
MAQPDDARTVRIGDRQGAIALVAQVMADLQALEAVLDAETALVRQGRLRDGLGAVERKTALMGAYLQGLEAAKANAIALARFAPEGIEGLKAAHRRFTGVVETNQIVLATARSVAEGLVKTLATEMSRSRVATVYGMPSNAPSPYGRAGAARSQPLMLSRNL